MRFVPEVQEAQPRQPSPLDVINDRISELFDVVKLHTGCGEFHRAGSGSVRLRAGPYAFEFTGDVGGAAGTRPDLAIAVDGDPLLETTMAETETTCDICERPARLYTVRDHLKARRRDESKSSEFPTAAVGMPAPEPMAVIDRHMEAVKVVYPSEYDAIAAKARSLHEAT